MTHQEIEDKEIIERYVRHQLSADERRAFQEHFFACDACFDNVQMTARFIAGVREASVAGAFAAPWTGTLDSLSSSPFRSNGFKSAFVFATAASVVLAAVLGWLVLNQIPKLRSELEREKQAREQIERQQQQTLDQTKAERERENQQLETERTERAKLQSQIEALARNQPPPVSGSKAAQVNTPIVILEAARDLQASNQLALSAGTNSATLWIEVESDNRFASYRLQILSPDSRVIETIAGAKPNAYGALAVTLNAKLLRAGKYVVKLYGVKSNQRELVGEYDLGVHKP